MKRKLTRKLLVANIYTLLTLLLLVEIQMITCIYHLSIVTFYFVHPIIKVVSPYLLKVVSIYRDQSCLLACNINSGICDDDREFESHFLPADTFNFLLLSLSTGNVFKPLYLLPACPVK